MTGPSLLGKPVKRSAMQRTTHREVSCVERQNMRYREPLGHGYNHRIHEIYACVAVLQSDGFSAEVAGKIKAEFGVDITIADEGLLSRQKSPFSTPRTLIDYLDDPFAEPITMEHDRLDFRSSTAPPPRSINTPQCRAIDEREIKVEPVSGLRLISVVRFFKFILVANFKERLLEIEPGHRRKRQG